MGKLHEETFNSFIKFLKAHGFPETSFAIGMPVGKFRVDLAIIDPGSKYPIAFFEFKESPKNRILGRMQPAPSSITALRDSDIPTYLVYQKDSDPPFEVERVYLNDKMGRRNIEKFKPENIPAYRVLKESAKNNIIQKKKEEQKKTFDSFKYVCWGMAFVLFTGTILDMIKVISINTNQLALIGASVALVIIPFAGKLKILGIEFERLLDKQE